MIFGAIRLALVWLVLMTVVYLLLWLYLTSVRRERLEDQFRSSGMEGDREAYIRSAMVPYRRRLKRWLIVLVYIVPVIVIVTTAYFVN